MISLDTMEKRIERVNQISDRKRGLMLNVWAGHDPVLGWLYQLDNMYRVEEILEWLIQNKLTGVRFIQYLRYEHDNSLLGLCSHILKEVLGYTEKRPIVAGKDWK